MKRKSIAIFILFLFFVGCASKPFVTLPTVERVDLNRYQGRWYEIARYENRFEEGCVGASATYTLNEDTVGVLNRCFDAEEKLLHEVSGHAKVVEKSENSKLRVSFFWPFYGDYWVLLLAEDYRYVVVGEPSRKYFWILSRTKTLSTHDTEHILNALPSLGYDPKKLYWTRYKVGKEI